MGCSAQLLIRIFLTVGAVENCQGLLTGLACVYAFTFPATSLHFLLRVRAIYTGRKLVTAFFVICWIALTGLSITFPFHLHGTRIGPTSHCMDTERQAITQTQSSHRQYSIRSCSSSSAGVSLITLCPGTASKRKQGCSSEEVVFPHYQGRF